MATGDGLLARLRPVGNRLTPAQLTDLARLALEHGNGLVEITARGNLQVRGLTPQSAPRFARAAATVIAVDTGPVIAVSPLMGDDPTEKADPTPLFERLHREAAPLTARLGPKVSVVLDGGGQLPLAALKADIRLYAEDATNWAVTLGGAAPLRLDGDGAVTAALALLRALAALGPAARATDLFPSTARASENGGQPDLPMRLRRRRGHAIAIALPFGQVHGDALVALARRCAAAGVATLRLAPGHALLLDDAPDALVEAAAALGFITDPRDPRRRVSACIGSAGCAAGHIAARRVAASLAPLLPEGRQLHVSGCSKGCAHPRPAAFTLVGRPDGVGLVIAGRAGDTPEEIRSEAALPAALAARWENR